MYYTVRVFGHSFADTFFWKASVTFVFYRRSSVQANEPLVENLDGRNGRPSSGWDKIRHLPTSAGTLHVCHWMFNFTMHLRSLQSHLRCVLSIQLFLIHLILSKGGKGRHKQRLDFIMAMSKLAISKGINCCSNPPLSCLHNYIQCYENILISGHNLASEGP